MIIAHTGYPSSLDSLSCWEALIPSQSSNFGTCYRPRRFSTGLGTVGNQIVVHFLFVLGWSPKLVATGSCTRHTSVKITYIPYYDFVYFIPGSRHELVMKPILNSFFFQRPGQVSAECESKSFTKRFENHKNEFFGKNYTDWVPSLSSDST